MSLTQMILHQFNTIYGLIIRPESTQYLEEELGDIVRKNNLQRNNVSNLIEEIANAYVKQNGQVDFVELEKLQEVFKALQFSQKKNLKDTETLMPEKVDRDKFLHVIDAFDMPRWKFSNEKKGFIRHDKPKVISVFSSKAPIYSERLDLIYQRLKRRSGYMKRLTGSSKFENKLSSLKDLRGREGEEFTIFGLLTFSEGKYQLEDKDWQIWLDLSECEIREFYTEGNFILAKGRYVEVRKFKVLSIEHPPLEDPDDTRKELGYLDFLGIPYSLEDEEVIKKYEKEWKNTFLVIISDLWLDQSKTLAKLRTMFKVYHDENLIPFVFVLIGNFLSEPFVNVEVHSAKYRAAFDSLGSLIAEFPSIARYSHFVFVPGYSDFCLNGRFPQRHIPNVYTSRLKSKVPKAVFTSNPCRIKYCSQEIVIFREDIVYKIKRNSIGTSKPLNAQESAEIQVTKTLLRQSHLCPFPLPMKPIYRDYDHTLRLYPVPDVVGGWHLLFGLDY
ncbi:88_t:CDS:10 [Cetraspora pellucida]|uniref:88_t:CDS:1 n=2 Tax=Cetraspora pellucida TaxID=1433469 RepID=A0ACA9KFJ7_9GLOM|nr:88_t:CDS:10 [Cetraspora pellucida]